jgi:hypothetical protein
MPKLNRQILVISFSNTIANPRTMMIEFLNTIVTVCAMVRSAWSHNTAGLTYLYYFLVSQVNNLEFLRNKLDLRLFIF